MYCAVRGRVVRSTAPTRLHGTLPSQAHGETIFLNLCRMKDKDKRLSVGKVLAAWNTRCFMDALRAALEADIEFAVDLIRACDAKPAVRTHMPPALACVCVLVSRY